jgi:cell division protease FtsH
MVTEYGMSERLGPRTFGRKEELVFLGREISEQRDYGDKVAEGIDEEVGTIIQNAKNVTRGVLTRERARLTRLAERLISEETLEEEELEKVFTEPLPAPGSEKLSAP